MDLAYEREGDPDVCPTLGAQIRAAVAVLYPEAETVVRLLDDLAKYADDVDAGGGESSAAGELLALAAMHAPHELRAVAANLRHICDLLGLRNTADESI